MKSDTQLMNELAHRTSYLHELTNEESAAMKAALLDIYKDIASLCQKHNLCVMMGGGTCLGAIRHKGFIPWDDDLDVMMPRADYQILLTLLEAGELGKKYEFTYPQKCADSKGPFLKIYRKNSLNVEIIGAGGDFPQGLYIDVFPMDYAPKHVLVQKLKGLFADGLQFIGILTNYGQFSTEKLDDFMAMDENLNKRYKKKKFLGKLIAYFIPHRKWVYWFDKFVACSKDTGKLGIPTGRKYYFGEIMDKSIFLPVAEVEFEGLKVFVPSNWDAYLNNLYHDYMQQPPIEKRERHFVYEVILPTD